MKPNKVLSFGFVLVAAWLQAKFPVLRRIP